MELLVNHWQTQLLCTDDMPWQQHAVHNYAHFTSNPANVPEQVIKQIAYYLSNS